MALFFLVLVFLSFYGFFAESQMTRVITDLEVIYGSHGVPIDYNYNETNNIVGAPGSVPGCPKSISGIPWIYFGSPPRCFLAETHGPCPYGERLLPQRDSQFGICACECLTDYGDYQTELQNQQHFLQCFSGEMSKIGEYRKINQLFDKKIKRCYTKYEKGPCLENTVLGTFNGDLKCLPLCDRSTGNVWEMEQNGRCFIGFDAIGQTMPGAISRNGCQMQNLRYSKTLRKCVRRNAGGMIVAG